MNREEVVRLIEEHVENKNILKHMFALEAVMGALWEKFKVDGTKEEWKLAGLLHDGDYCEAVAHEKQGIQITDWARERGIDISENVAHAMAAHNWDNTGVEPINKMDWSIFAADSLTGLIVACALVLPTKKLSDVTTTMVLKKFDQKSFAGGTRREDIKMCEEKLGIPLPEFVEIALSAMQEIHESLGL